MFCSAAVRGELTSHLLSALSQPFIFVFSCTDRFHLGLLWELCVQISVAWECCRVLNYLQAWWGVGLAAPEPPCCKGRTLGRTAL